jgi:hypothetical protein
LPGAASAGLKLIASSAPAIADAAIANLEALASDRAEAPTRLGYRCAPRWSLIAR